MSTHPIADTWADAERTLRAALHRLAAVDHDLRSGTTGLHWRGGAADRFAGRTHRRHLELNEQQESLRYLLTLVQAAAPHRNP